MTDEHVYPPVILIRVIDGVEGVIGEGIFVVSSPRLLIDLLNGLGLLWVRAASCSAMSSGSCRHGSSQPKGSDCERAHDSKLSTKDQRYGEDFVNSQQRHRSCRLSTQGALHVSVGGLEGLCTPDSSSQQGRDVTSLPSHDHSGSATTTKSIVPIPVRGQVSSRDDTISISSRAALSSSNSPHRAGGRRIDVTLCTRKWHARMALPLPNRRCSRCGDLSIGEYGAGIVEPMPGHETSPTYIKPNR